MQFTTAEKVAEALAVSPKSIYRWAADGTIPCVRIKRAVRFVMEEVLQRVRQGNEEAN